MAYDFLLLDVTDRIATVTVNRPDKLNALNDQVMGELGLVFAELATRDDVGAIILTGAGRAFVAGADIAALAQANPTELQARSRRGQTVFRSIERSSKPVIAAVNGFAFGGGCELALACHIRIASESAKFALPEVKLGLIPGYGGTQRLPRLIGRGPALQLMLTGDAIDGAEAYRLGIANAVTAPDALLAAARTMASTMLKNGPVAMARAIEVVDRGLDGTLDDGIALESQFFGALADTADMREGTSAFLAKRPAVFEGK
ncbi:MAG: enoyl-CoA hydratase-related protein [Gemmatimonadetes bacterium]|nr:enoyl-CoA hydratase-related protein [Gemmatimonadota bacterium]